MKFFALLVTMIFSSVAQADTVIQSIQGSDSQTTRPFTVEGPWEIQWEASGDIFQIYLYSSSGDLEGVPANQMGPGSGSAFQPKGGSFYLQMNALGSWNVTVVSVD